MLNKLNKVPIFISRFMLVYLSAMLLLIPVRLLFAVTVSAVVHELFHIAALRLMKIQIYAVHIGIRGARIETAQMADKEELVCSLAGPIGGLMLLFLFRWMPVIALAGAVQSLYNLLPVYPTDGGRALRCGLNMMLPKRITQNVICTTEIVTLSIIVALCIYGAVLLRLGIIPVMFSTIMLLRCAKTNNPCKA